MNLFVQILANRAQRVLKNTDGESNRIFGLTISASVSVDPTVGSAPSSDLYGGGEADPSLVFFEIGATVDSMALGWSGFRSEGSVDSGPGEKN